MLDPSTDTSAYLQVLGYVKSTVQNVIIIYTSSGEVIFTAGCSIITVGICLHVWCDSKREASKACTHVASEISLGYYFLGSLIITTCMSVTCVSVSGGHLTTRALKAPFGDRSP